MMDDTRRYLEVTVADITISSLGFVVFLRELDGDNTLPIFIGAPEAQAIAITLNKVPTPRPLTHDLFRSVLNLLDGRVMRILITELRENTYYARMEIEKSDGDIVSIDSRPSDAIAMALRIEAPIFVSSEVMGESSISYRDAQAMNLQLDRDDESAPPVVRRAQSMKEKLQSQLQEALDEERYEEAAQIRDELRLLESDN